MIEEALKRAAWRIIQLTAFTDREGVAVYGEDTCVGTREELTAEAFEILQEELGMNVSGNIVAGCTWEEHAERVRLAFQPVTTLEV
jgi:hypothetical protein